MLEDSVHAQHTHRVYVLEEGLQAVGQCTCWRTVYVARGQCACWRRVYVLEEGVRLGGQRTC